MNQKLRTEILARDNRMCQKCGYSDIDCLEIHHIDKNPMNNNPSNLITFCRQCHLGVHNRKYTGHEGYLGKLKGNEDEFTTLWHKGKTYSEIMYIFDISSVTVSNWRMKLGLLKRVENERGGRGVYIQLPIYISDSNEMLIGEELERRGVGMATFLDEVKADALQRATQNLGKG